MLRRVYSRVLLIVSNLALRASISVMNSGKWLVRLAAKSERLRRSMMVFRLSLLVLEAGSAFGELSIRFANRSIEFRMGDRP